MRVRLFNAKYSPNLGDGLLSECLERGLIAGGCSREDTYSIDVAARTEYIAGGSSRSAVLRILQLMPDALRRMALAAPLAAASRLKWRPHYRKHLVDADAVVIGGGNLFADIDLNFPTKLSLLLDEAKRRRLPVFIYGVGVASGWSEAGIAMIRDAFRGSNIPFVAVRDMDSKKSFDKHFGDALPTESIVVRDPGLLISRHVKAVGRGSRDNKMVGLCITSAVAIRYHSAFSISDQGLEDWFVAVYEKLSSEGYGVKLFTNGSPEDVESAHRVVATLTAKGSFKGDQPTLRPQDPTELAQVISGCDLVIAFRMHALIAAYSYGAEIIALKWDRKLDSFMSSVGLGDWILWPGEAGADSVISMVRQLFQKKLNVEASAVEEASSDVGKLLAAINALPKG